MALGKAVEHSLGQSVRRRKPSTEFQLKVPFKPRDGLINGNDRTPEFERHKANASRITNGGALGYGGARVGAPKVGHQNVIHPGMTRQQIDGALAFGGSGRSHAAATVDGGVTVTSSAAAAPLDHAYGGDASPKHGKLAPIHPAMRTAANRQAHGRTQEAHANLARNVSANAVRT
jgi:hypothetical protein